MPEDAIALDTSVIDTPPEPIIEDQPIDTGETPPEGADIDPVDPDPDAEKPPEGEAEPFTGRVIENGKINPAVKAELNAIKAKNPAMEKQIRNALIRQDVLSREFPGGLTEVKAKISDLTQTIEEIGGADGIKSTKQELAFFHDIDQQFTAGDPRFIEALIASPEGQASFIKLAPSMIEKYASMHPEGFESFVHGHFMNEMGKSDLKLEIIRMKDWIDRLPDGTEKAGIQQHWAGLANFYNGVAANAAKKVEPPKSAAAAPPANDGREQQLSQREAAIKETEFQSTWNGELKSIFTAQWDRLTKGRTLDDIKTANAKELFSGILKRALAADATSQANLKKFYAAGDRSGYQRTVKALFDKEIPKALSSALDRADPQKGPKKAVAPAVNGSGAPAKPGVAAPAGFSPVNKVPTFDQVDFGDGKTTLGMWQEGKAVLKNGRRVSFSR